MRFLPIVARELRVASRRPATYWTRVAAASVAILVGGWQVVFLTAMAGRTAAGQAVLWNLAGFAFAYCLIVGLRNTTDCLSREKREGTLGLLFLTDLKGYDIVLGKLAATSINALYGLAAIAPVVTIPLLLGGVEAVEVARVLLVLLNALLFALACGMVASAFSSDDRRAAGLGFLLLITVAGLMPLVGSLAIGFIRQRFPEAFAGKLSGLPLVHLWFSPGYTLAKAFTGGKEFWVSLGSVHALSWVLLGLASLRLPRAWQDRPVSARASDGIWRWRTSVELRAAFRQRALDLNPFYWLLARVPWQTAGPWVLLGGAAGIWLWLGWKYPNDWFDPSIYVTTAILLHCLLKLWVAGRASYRLAHDRTNGALELVLSTPLGVRDILRGHWVALHRQFRLPVLVVLVFDAGCLYTRADDLNWVAVWLAGMGMLVADLYTLYWVGMWAGLTARQVNRAASQAVARVLVLPWVLYLLVTPFLAFWYERKAQEMPDVGFWVGLWFALGIGCNLYFGVRSRRQLLTQFRSRAAGRPAESGWGRLGRRLGRWWQRRLGAGANRGGIM